MAVKIPRARLPRLLTLENNVWREERRLYPTAANLHLKLNGISQSGLTMEPADKELDMHAFVEIYTVKGSAGIYRVTNPSHRAGVSSTYTLQHAIDTLNDCLWKAQTDFKGTARAFLQGVLACQNDVYWQLGTCEDSGQYKKTGINYDKALDLLLEFATSRLDYYLNFDFTTWPWTLHWKALPMDVRAEWRARRNVRSCSITKNDAEQCTRLYYTVSPPEGQEADPTVHVLNNLAAQARPGVGIIEKAITIDADVVADPAAEAQRYLADHEYPGVQVTVDGYEYYRQTGDSLDCFDLGILTRCLVEGIGPVRERLVGLVYPDLLDDGEHVSAEMATSLPRFSESLLQAAKAAASAGRRASSAASKAKEEADEQYRHWVTENKVYKESVFKIMGVVLDENGNVVYEQAKDQQGNPIYDQEGKPVYVLDDAGNPKPVYDPDSGGSLSGITKETAQNYTRLYELTGVNALGENETILTRVQQNARQYAIDAVENNMSGYLRIDAFSTKLGNELTGANGETIAANIVTKINGNQGTIYLNSDHVKLKDGSIITATTLDARLANIDAVVAQTISAGTFLSASTGRFNTLWVESPGANGATNTAQVNNAINGLYEYTPTEEGKIGFQFTTLANPTKQSINFNIADTKYFKDRVGIEATGLTVTEIGEAPYNNHSADEITTPEIKAGTSAKYYLIQATAKDGTTTVYKKFTLPAASAPPVTASIDDITGTSIAANHIKDTSIPLTASGTNVAAYTENLTLEETTYQVGSITRPCVVLKLDGSVIGRIYTGNSYNRGWDAAADVVDLPVGSASPGQSMALSVPYKRTANGTTTRGTDQITYTLRVDQKYAYISTVGGNDSVINYAKYEHNQYTLGQNSVSASLPTGTPPAGTNASELSPGTYALTLTKGSTPSVLGYYTVPAAAVVTPKVSKGNWGTGTDAGKITFTAGTTGDDTASVALSVGVTPGTGSSTILKVKDGQDETGANLTLYVQGDDQYCYITNTAVTPNANNTLARITNPKTAPAASIDSIVLRKAGGVEYVYVDDDREFAVYVQATGTNVSAKDETLYIDAGDAVDHGKRLVTAVLAETATSAAAPATLVSGKTYNLYRVVDGTRESKAVSSYTVPAAAAPVSASIDDLSGVAIDENALKSTIAITASGTNVASRSENVKLAKTTYPVGATPTNCVTLTMDGVVIGRISTQSVYIDGRDSVTITSVERVASCAFDHDAQTAKQDVKVTLSNGQSYTIHEDFSDVYRAGRNGTAIDTFVDYAADLSSGGVVFDPGVEEDADGDPLRIDLSDIYQAGQNYTPPVKHWYTYSPTGGDVPIYVQSVGSSSGSSGSIGEAIGNLLNKFTVSTTIAFYPYTPVEVVGTLKGYTQVTYNGTTYLLDPSNLKESEDDLSIDHRTGIKDLTVTRTITLSRIVHTAGTSNSITLTVQREGERNPSNAVSSYVSLREFNNLTVNDNAGNYFDYLSYLSGYFASHDPQVYGDTINHKAVFTETYTENGETVTEYIVVSFDSYAYADESQRVWWEITNYYNNYGFDTPVTFTPANGPEQTLAYSEGYSSLTVSGEDASTYIPGDITYAWNSNYYQQMTCRFRVRWHLSDGKTEDIIIKKVAHMEEAPSPDAFTGYVYATNGGSVKVRATAGGSEIGSLTPNTQVTVLSKEGSYYKIEFEGVQGYMVSSYVINSSGSPSNYKYTGWVKDIAYVEIVVASNGSDQIVHAGGYTGTIVIDLAPAGMGKTNYRSLNAISALYNSFSPAITGSLSYYLGTVNNYGNLATHSKNIYKSNLTHRLRAIVHYADGTPSDSVILQFTSVPV